MKTDEETNRNMICKFCKDPYSDMDILLLGQHFCSDGKRIPPEELEYDTTKKVYSGYIMKTDEETNHKQEMMDIVNDFIKLAEMNPGCKTPVVISFNMYFITYWNRVYDIIAKEDNKNILIRGNRERAVIAIYKILESRKEL